MVINVSALFVVQWAALTDASGRLSTSWAPPAAAIGFEVFSQGLVHDIVNTGEVLASNVIGITIAP